MRGNLPQEIEELLFKLEGMDPGLPKAEKCSLLQSRDYDSKDLKKKKPPKKQKTEARKTLWAEGYPIQITSYQNQIAFCHREN